MLNNSITVQRKKSISPAGYVGPKCWSPKNSISFHPDLHKEIAQLAATREVTFSTMVRILCALGIRKLEEKA